MPPPQGLIQFPGIRQWLSARFTLSHGITPSTCVLQIPWQDLSTAEGGTLSLTFAGTRLDFPNCKVDKAKLVWGESGWLIEVTILDRRWKWAFGAVNGSYNLIDLATWNTGAPPPVDVATAANARQLAVLCLQAMNETVYDVSALPVDAFPPVTWEDANPAKALSDLAQQFGCRVVLTTANSVLIARTGQGAALPAGQFVEQSLTVDPPEVPDSITVSCGPTLYEDLLPLTAVGEDTDGTIKPINQLSYMPAGGWAAENPLTFAGVSTSGIYGTVPRELALKSVYRWYGLYIGPNSKLQLNCYQPPITQVGQLLPLNDVRVAQGTVNGQSYQLPAVVVGSSFNLLNPGNSWMSPASANSAINAVLEVPPFSLDRARGIVKFREPVMIRNPPGTPQNVTLGPAQLWLLTSFSIRDATWSWVRYRQTQQIPGAHWNTGTRILRHEEVQQTVQANYEMLKPVKGSVQQFLGLTTTLDQTEINYYLAAALAEYDQPPPQEVLYPGILAVSPDGAIEQVTWTIDQSGAKTRASRCMEHDSTVPAYRTRRFWERFRDAALERQQQQIAALRAAAAARP
jgi:hypothetical protein